MDLICCQVELNHLVRTAVLLSECWILVVSIGSSRLLSCFLSILNRFKHLLWSCSVHLALKLVACSSHGLLLLRHKVMVRNNCLPKSDALIIVLRVNHLSTNRVLHRFFQIVLAEFLQIGHYFEKNVER